MSHTSLQRHEKTVSENRNLAIHFNDLLDTLELLVDNANLTVVELDTSDLVISGEAINTDALTLTIDGVDVAVPIGHAVTFHVTGGLADTCYQILVTVETDASIPQTFQQKMLLNVEADS